MEALEILAVLATIAAGMITIGNEISKQRERKRQRQVEQEAIRKTERQRQANRELAMLALGGLFVWAVVSS